MEQKYSTSLDLLADSLQSLEAWDDDEAMNFLLDVLGPLLMDNPKPE
jgi:hypothetical protein